MCVGVCMGACVYGCVRVHACVRVHVCVCGQAQEARLPAAAGVALPRVQVAARVAEQAGPARAGADGAVLRAGRYLSATADIGLFEHALSADLLNHLVFVQKVFMKVPPTTILLVPIFITQLFGLGRLGLLVVTEIPSKTPTVCLYSLLTYQRLRTASALLSIS